MKLLQEKNNNQKPLNETIKTIFSILSSEPKQKNAKLTNIWPKVAGAEIAKRTKVKFSKSGVTVTTNSSAFAFEISQKFGDLILKRLQNEFGENEVQKIWVNVGRID